MASSSTSSVKKSFKYDVFLSFRGEDVRKTFVDHLYHALQYKCIITYKDDEKIEKGERINDQLIRSIKDSKFYIIVFSKNYASSSWCLDELVQIMECQETREQTAYPIFYDVEPTEVRHQSGAVEEAFAKHVEKEPAGRWRNALKRAANLAGWELKTTVDGHEAKFIQKIVKDISLKPHFINSSVDEKLVGMGTRVQNIVSSLELDSDDVRAIGIKGIGGGGKTTLARAVFDNISNWFEGYSFVENVREVSKGSGLKELQKQVLKDVLNDQSIDVTSVSGGKYKMRKMIPSRKVLLVLDDVDDIDQLEALAGELTWFKPGSRIIITTRDEQVLVAHGVNFIHDVNLLSHKEAICLFSRYAFKIDIPNHGYIDLSRKIVHYASGLPLTIKLLGSLLCGKSKPQWVDAIERLKTIPLDKTLKRLELSYNGLENDEKEIFLDVVCMLKGERKDRAIQTLESCGFNAQIGLKVLEQKSLVTLSKHHTLGFHDHIEELGRNIVRRLHPNEPSRHSRLWIKEEIHDILVNELGTEETKCIKLKFTDVDPIIIMKGLRKMKELRFLYVHNGPREFNAGETNQYFQYWVQFGYQYPLRHLSKTSETNYELVNNQMYESNIYDCCEVSQYLPDSLQFLCWYRYPFGYLPRTFRGNKLVKLEINDSSIFELWEGEERKVLHKLRFLDCIGSKLRTFDFRMTPCLEALTLAECHDFVELRMLNECPKLKLVDLSSTKVRYFNLGMCTHLEELNFQRCYLFEELHIPIKCYKLKVLNLSGSMVSNLNLGMIPHLEELNLEACDYLQEILAPVGCLKNLVYLNLSGCARFEFFLVDKRNVLPSIDSQAKLQLVAESLDTCPLHPKNDLPKFQFSCRLVEPLPSSSGNLERLLSFGLCACTNLGSFSASICGLKHLRELRLEGNIPEIPKNLGNIRSLEKLSLWTKEIKYLPDSICTLKLLKYVNLKSCLLLEELPKELGKLECLEELNLTDCIQLDSMPEELGSLECLKEVRMDGMSVSHLPQSIYQLKGLRIYGSRGQLESYGFTSLTKFPSYRGSYYVEL